MTAPTPVVDTGEYRARVASLGWTLTSPGEVVSEGSREIGLTLVDGLFLADQLDTAIGKLAEVEALAAGADRDDHGLHCAEPAGGPCECWAADILAIIRRPT